MDIVCGFRNIQEMARAVRGSAELIEGRKFSPRPWNRFEPENTDWWIVPSTDWPAYRYGKGMFKFSGLFPERILCCLNVEKGFGRIAAEVYPELVSRGYIVDENWTWFTFLKGLADGAVAHAAQMVAKETNNPVILEISAWYTSSPIDFDPYPLLDAEALAGECRSPLDGGRVWFIVEGEELRKLEERCVKDVMAPVAACRRLSDLPEAFQSTRQLPWAWIDVHIGTLVSLAPSGQASSTHWGASDIWRKLLRPWRRWIV